MTPPSGIALRAFIEKWRSRIDRGYDPEEIETTTAFWRGARLVISDLDALIAADASPSLFRSGVFHLHGGQTSRWKIDCDALTDADLETLALMLSERVSPFGRVEGVLSGGLCLAAAMRKFVTSGPLLIVDDVLTTGTSMEAQRNGREAIGAVLFARGACPAWVRPLFQLACANASPSVNTMPVWKLLNEADDEKTAWSTTTWQQWFVKLVDAVSGVDADIERQADASVETPASPHRCSGCGLRWNGSLHGAELCGDCWRNAQPIVHAAVSDPPVSPPEESSR